MTVNILHFTHLNNIVLIQQVHELHLEVSSSQLIRFMTFGNLFLLWYWKESKLLVFYG